jgi:hypothetical protein
LGVTTAPNFRSYHAWDGGWTLDWTESGRMAGRWVEVAEAARELGISTDAVRKRIARGSLESDRPNGNVLVWLDGSGTEAGRADQVEGGELVDVLREQVYYLRSQLDVWAEEIQRRDVIISQLTQATSNLTDRLRELEPPVQQPMRSEEAPDAAQEAATDVPGPRRPGAGGTGPQNGSEEIRRRSWWREFFGFD